MLYIGWALSPYIMWKAYTANHRAIRKSGSTHPKPSYEWTGREPRRLKQPHRWTRTWWNRWWCELITSTRLLLPYRVQWKQMFRSDNRRQSAASWWLEEALSILRGSIQAVYLLCSPSPNRVFGGSGQFVRRVIQYRFDHFPPRIPRLLLSLHISSQIIMLVQII